jgi:hypothetical protein
VAEWLGAGLQNPSPRFNSGRRLGSTARPVTYGGQRPNIRALSSEGERFLDTEEVRGSIPLGPTVIPRGGRPPFDPPPVLVLRSSRAWPGVWRLVVARLPR